MKNPEVVAYPAVFDNQNNGGFYTVTFPDIPDTVSQGKTLKDAIREAPDALAVALPDYEEYPHPSDLKQVQDENPHKVVRLVRVNMKEKLARMGQRPTDIHDLFDGWKDDGVRESELDWGERKGHEYK